MMLTRGLNPTFSDLNAVDLENLFNQLLIIAIISWLCIIFVSYIQLNTMNAKECMDQASPPDQYRFPVFIKILSNLILTNSYFLLFQL